MKGKQIAHRDMRGDKGIALIHRIVNEMGFVWNALHLEAGIDGIIELRDPGTAEVSNCIIQVQSKAGPSYFKAETDSSFEFVCDERDLNYWLRGNAPVILVVSRPDDDEAYWVSLKDYFHDPGRRKTRKVVFDKSASEFSMAARDALARLAMPAESGLYLPALPCNEVLVSNLLPLVNYPKRLFRASTKLRFPTQVWEVLNKHDRQSPAEWVLHNCMLYSFHDLTFEPWTKACLSETTENLPTERWALSDDRDERYVFTRMLHICFGRLLNRHGVRFSRDKDHYFFKSTPDLKEKKIGGLSVFKGYESKKVEGRIAYYRHRAMKHRFLRFDGQWYVEVTPSYHFTQDGFKLSRFFEERLTGIKQVERQNKVHLRQLRLWESVLRQNYQSVTQVHVEFQQRSLFGDEDEPVEEIVEQYPHLTLGELVHFSVDWGVPEKAWLPPGSDEEPEEDSLQGRLFDV